MQYYCDSGIIVICKNTSKLIDYALDINKLAAKTGTAIFGVRYVVVNLVWEGINVV